MDENKLEPTRSIMEDNGALARFLGGIMEKAGAFVRHFDSQTNTLIGISSAIFVFAMSATKQYETLRAPFFILGLFAGLSALFGLYAIHPPRFMRKRRQGESLMYNKRVTGFASHELYAEALKDMLADRNKILDQHALETYNLYKYYYRPKRKLFNYARNILMIGIVLSLITFLFLFLK